VTPKEAADCADRGSKQLELQEFIVGASPRDLQEFCHGLEAGVHSKHFPLARIALDIRLAEDAENQAKRFEQQMGKLLGIAEAQRLLAEKLERQTNTTIGLTRALNAFTVFLIVLMLVLVVEGGCQFFESRKTLPRLLPNTERTNQPSVVPQHDQTTNK
jgi:hypothetical protein